jgi:hypothetical protein
LLRDSDNKLERRDGLNQARAEWEREGPNVAIIIGLAHPARECWVLVGFSPENDAEKSRLAKAHKELGFDPTQMPERLNAHEASDLRNRKRVLTDLTNGDFERERWCWQPPKLAVLKDRGAGVGLSDYLEEVRLRLVPLFRRDATTSADTPVPPQS